jgi:hypothetical protein
MRARNLRAIVLNAPVLFRVGVSPQGTHQGGALPRTARWHVYVAALSAAFVFLQAACSRPGATTASPPAPPEAHGLRLPEPPQPTYTAAPSATATAAVRRVQDILLALEKFDNAGRPETVQRVYFELAESDINDYLAYSLKVRPRPGIDRAGVRFQDNNHISAAVAVDFDQIAAWAPLIPSLFQPLLSASRPVAIDIAFEVRDSAVTFQFTDLNKPEDALVRRVMQTLVHILALHQPERYDSSRPLPLPFGLRRAWTTHRILGGET